MTGSLSGLLARIKVVEKNCFGMIEWKAVREAASRFLPKHTAAAWKNRNLSHVEQEGLPPVPKDRSAEQGDVDGPLECSLALGMVAAETRGSIDARGKRLARSCMGTATASRPRSQSSPERRLGRSMVHGRRRHYRVLRYTVRFFFFKNWPFLLL